MKQLNLFDLPLENLFSDYNLEIEQRPIKTLKREVKRRLVDPDEVARKLQERIGTLYLHMIKLKEIEGSYHHYYEYFIRKIHNHYFSDIIASITYSSYEEQFKAIEALLSDDEVKVSLAIENSRFAQMVNGVAFRIKVSSIEKETVYITGSKFTTKSKHKARRWFPKSGEHTTRTVANVNRIFSELLLQKEARHYYRQPLNHELYKSILRNQFIRSDSIHIHPEVKAKEPVIMDSLMEEAALSDLTIRENATESNYPSIMGYYGKLSVAGLGMYYRHDLDARAEYGLYETSIGRVIEKHMIANVVPRIHEVNYHINSLRKSSGEYAATFQLKKNIPEKTLERMNTSPLLKYFDEVEYDELVDLETIKQFENEIISFIKTFKIPVPANASFKVRRLGKIKAAGVFYPFYNTLAVDVNHPNSFIHEYWHMIDYYMKDNSSHFTGERLSSRRDFLDIVKEYKDVVGKTIEKLPDSSAVKCLHYGKTKYNKDYYFENTEVFARCAEMYFAKALNGKSSLVGDVESAYYPTDSKLNDMINQYFTNLLLEVDHEKTDAA